MPDPLDDLIAGTRAAFEQDQQHRRVFDPIQDLYAAQQMLLEQEARERAVADAAEVCRDARTLGLGVFISLGEDGAPVDALPTQYLKPGEVVIAKDYGRDAL